MLRHQIQQIKRLDILPLIHPNNIYGYHTKGNILTMIKSYWQSSQSPINKRFSNTPPGLHNNLKDLKAQTLFLKTYILLWWMGTRGISICWGKQSNQVVPSNDAQISVYQFSKQTADFECSRACFIDFNIYVHCFIQTHPWLLNKPVYVKNDTCLINIKLHFTLQQHTKLIQVGDCENDTLQISHSALLFSTFFSWKKSCGDKRWVQGTNVSPYKNDL